MVCRQVRLSRPWPIQKLWTTGKRSYYAENVGTGNAISKSLEVLATFRYLLFELVALLEFFLCIFCFTATRVSTGQTSLAHGL